PYTTLFRSRRAGSSRRGGVRFSTLPAGLFRRSIWWDCEIRRNPPCFTSSRLSFKISIYQTPGAHKHGQIEGTDKPEGVKRHSSDQQTAQKNAQGTGNHQGQQSAFEGPPGAFDGSGFKNAGQRADNQPGGGEGKSGVQQQ